MGDAIGVVGGTAWQLARRAAVKQAAPPPERSLNACTAAWVAGDANGAYAASYNRGVIASGVNAKVHP